MRISGQVRPALSEIPAIVALRKPEVEGQRRLQQLSLIGRSRRISKKPGAKPAREVRSGPSRDWLKVKNPDSPAMIRAREVDW
jgi:hypothetical protein